MEAARDLGLVNALQRFLRTVDDLQMLHVSLAKFLPQDLGKWVHFGLV